MASAEDSENISGASVVVNVAENPGAEIVPPEPEPEPEQGETPDDSQTETETQTGQTETPEENRYYELDGDKLYPSMLIPSDIIPEGFKEGHITLWEESYPYKKGGSKKLCLLYLVDENHENGALYMVEKNAPYEVYPFVCVDRGTYRKQDVSAAPEGKDDSSTQDIEKLKSQNRLILCAFIVVVLVLLIIIVILMIKRGDDSWEELEKPLPKEERKKPETKKKPESKQDVQPKKKTQPERKTEVKKKKETEKSPEPKQTSKPKRSAFWDAMFAGIDDDLSVEGFEEEEPEETRKKEKPKKELPKKELPKREAPEKETKKNDEDIEFIDL